MSVLIKGMAMPKNCLACPLVSGFILWAEGRTPPTIDTRMCRIKREMKYTPNEEKPSWCPLVEIAKPSDAIAYAMEEDAKNCLDFLKSIYSEEEDE